MTSDRGSDRLGGLAALGFSATYFTNMVLTDVPDQGDTDATTRAFYAVDSHRIQAAVAAYVLAVAMVCFLVMLGRLVRRLSAAAPDSSASQIAMAAGTAYVGLSLAAGAAFVAPAASVVLHLDASSSVEPGFARAASTLGDTLLLIAAPIAASAFVAAVCLAARRAGMLPRWVTAPGLVVAASLVVGALWFPLLLLVAWTLSLGAAMLLSSPPPEPPRVDHEGKPGAAPRDDLTTQGA